MSVIVVVVVGCLVIAMGLLGLISPDLLIDLVKRAQTPVGLYSAAGLRVVLGSAMCLAAPQSRAPLALWIVGIVVVVVGVVTPFVGLERSRRLLEAWWSRGSTFTRIWAMCVTAVGAALVYAVAP